MGGEFGELSMAQEVIQVACFTDVMPKVTKMKTFYLQLFLLLFILQHFWSRFIPDFICHMQRTYSYIYI